MKLREVIGKYVLANKDERRVLRLALQDPEEFRLSDAEFVEERYGITSSLARRAAELGEDISYGDWMEARDASLEECRGEALKIDARKPDYRNMAHNIGLALVDCTLGLIVNVTGAFGGGVRWVPAERVPNYSK